MRQRIGRRCRIDLCVGRVHSAFAGDVIPRLDAFDRNRLGTLKRVDQRFAVHVLSDGKIEKRQHGRRDVEQRGAVQALIARTSGPLMQKIPCGRCHAAASAACRPLPLAGRR